MVAFEIRSKVVRTNLISGALEHWSAGALELSQRTTQDENKNENENANKKHLKNY